MINKKSQWQIEKEKFELENSKLDTLGTYWNSNCPYQGFEWITDNNEYNNRCKVKK